MKRISLAICLLSIIAFSSCVKVEAFDVEEVRFPMEGGTVIINCTSSQGCHIFEYNGEQGEYINFRDGRPNITTLYWLTAELLSDTQLKLTAGPNDTGKKRKLWLSGMVKDLTGRIPVIQE